MEISRRHLQDTERAELSELLQIDSDAHSILNKLRAADVERMKDHPDAAEMQRQVDGLTRNQRRVLNKRMRKAAKK